MIIDILTIDHMTHLNIQAPRGPQNAGGGMAALINSAKAELLRWYDVKLYSDVAQLRGEFVVLDAVSITNRIIEGLDKEDVTNKTIVDLEEDKCKNPKRKYLLWCAEKSLLRWKPDQRKKVLKIVDAVVVTVPYLWELFRVVDVTPIGYLCDAINPDLFRPAKKEMTVTAVGGLKYIKNIEWIIEVFKRLEGKIKRTYLGSAALWSHEKRKEDMELIDKIKGVTDVYHPNASIVEVAYHNAFASFAVNDTWHDCSSRANEELLMSGVISIHGQHPLFRGRPGFTVKTPEQAVAKITELTNDFTELPDPALQQASREWALKNVSTQTFMHQFETIIRTLI